MIQCRCFNLRKINPFFNMPVGAWIRGSYMWQPPNFSFPIRLCYERISVAKKSWDWENCLHVLSFPNSGNALTSKVAHPPVLTDKASDKASYKVARPPVLTKHLLEPRSTFYVRLLHMTSSNKTSFQLIPISHKIVGVNNKCSKDNRLVTA